ncbi:hypothetical protein Tco_0496187 [Tanacetum coccineum]
MAAVEVPQTLEYRGGQLNAALVLELVKGSQKDNGLHVKKAQLRSDDSSFIMSVLPDDQMNSIINCLTAKSTWDDLILYHEGPSDMKESRVMDLKLCYNTFNFKEDSPDEERGYKKSHDCLNGLKRRISSKNLFLLSLKDLQKWVLQSSAAKQLTKLNATNVARRVILQETAGQRLQFHHINHPFNQKSLSSPQHKPKLMAYKDLKQIQQIQAKLALLSFKCSAFKPQRYNNQGLSLKPMMIPQFGQKDLVFVKSSADDTKVSIPGVERPWLSEAEGFILPNHDTGRILPAESQRNTTDPSVAVTDSSATDYDSADESSVCSTPLPPLKKLDGAEPISGPKTIKSILRSKSTFKAETLKGVIINEPSSALAKNNKSSSASKVNSAPAGKLKSVKIKDDPPLAIIIKELNNLKFNKV